MTMRTSTLGVLVMGTSLVLAINTASDAHVADGGPGALVLPIHQQWVQ
jgi:hypothetical protein